MIHILFEQSGTFKHAFNLLGYEAITYDIENRFNKTDVVIDLFNEIAKASAYLPSIFDNIKENDFVIAFFPCTHFSGQNDLIYNKQFRAFKQWDELKINQYINDRKNKRFEFYNILTNLIHIVTNKRIKFIFENPYHRNYLLTTDKFRVPSLIIHDRKKLGDSMKKPTMFYHYNFELVNNDIELVFNNDLVIRKHNDLNKGISRSIIEKEFAINFINKYLKHGVLK